MHTERRKKLVLIKKKKGKISIDFQVKVRIIVHFAALF